MNDLTLRLEVIIPFVIVYIMIFITGMIGNVALIATIAKRKNLHTAANFFIANLAAGNILLIFTSVPFAPITLFMKKWHFGSFMCKFIPYAQGLSVLISSFGLCGIAIDRYR